MIARPLAAAALITAVLPLTAGSPAQAEEAAPAFGGFSAETTATPLRIEMYEPSIPIPSSPQLEFRLAYSKSAADSGSSSGRASYLWPGDPVGEGAKTFMEALGLPAELAAGGYPFQVNSSSPSGEPTASDEPLPGMVMRTSSADGESRASAGFSTDGDVDEKEQEEGTGGLDPEGLPGLDAFTSPVQELLSSRAAAEESEPSAPGLPPELAALVDVDGFVATSRTTSSADQVVSTSRSSLGEIKLLAGLVRIAGVDTRSTSTSDGTSGTTTGRSRYGTLTLADQEFTIGPDGIEAAGTPTPIPGLSDDPAKALESLGIKIVVPKPEKSIDGDHATHAVQALRIEIDTAVLRPVLSSLPTGQVAELMPDDAGPLKSLVGALSSLAPRVVLTLGLSESETETVPMIDTELPTAPVETEEPTEEDSGSGSTGGGGDTSSSGTTPGASTPGTAPGDVAGSDGTLDDSTPVSASPGLPPLGSVPGMLLFGGIALAAIAGSWFRKLGALALGAGAPCPHGLDSGLPDLRKM